MIYADYNATTPIDERVLEVLFRSMREDFGNPASIQHDFGRRAQQAVDTARIQVAEAIGANPQGVIFTSGATESISLGIHGLLARSMLKSSPVSEPQVLVGANEHKAVLASVEKWTKQFGLSVREIPCLRNGQIDIDWLRAKASVGTVLIAVAAVNNETGCINPIKEVGEIAKSFGADFFCDMTQSFGKIEIDFDETEIDLAAISSHKIYGPKGVGALIGKRKILRHMPSIQSGGGQESGLRGGTLNVPGIRGFGLACEIAKERIKDYQIRVGALSLELENALTNQIDEVFINGIDCERVANTVSLRIKGVDAEALLTRLKGIAISTGSACQSAVPAPSHVLVAMGLDHDEAREVIRISLGWPSTHEEVEEIVEQIRIAVKDLRELGGRE